MEFQPLTTYARVRKVEKKTGRIIATTYTKMTDRNGNLPSADDIYQNKYRYKETPEAVYLVFECSATEYATKKKDPVKKRDYCYLQEDLYEEIRLAQYTGDYVSICDLLTNLSPDTLRKYFNQ